MTMTKHYALPLLLGVIIGAVGMLIATGLVENDKAETGVGEQEEPLYWVAPMDPDYRRDRPGKSPMGMDLVPVYAQQAEAGLVEIAPEIVNNLGVRTARVISAPIDERIRTVGYVQYDQDRLIHIHPRVEGWVDRLHVKASGERVERGEPLYELYSPQLVNAQEEMILALRNNNERLMRAAEDRLLSLQLGEEFVASLKRDGVVRQTVKFHSPQNGVVDDLNIREGYFVGPTKTLMSIAALDEVWVEAEIFESQAALVRVGQAVTMRLDYLPGREWRGRVDYVYPSLESTTRTLRVRLRFDNASGELRPNMFAQIVIHAEDDREVLVVPREALIRTGDQDRVVMSLGEGRFRSRVVHTGRLVGDKAEVLHGLEFGDEVVISAQFLLDSESSKTADLRRMEAHSHD